MASSEMEYVNSGKCVEVVPRPGRKIGKIRRRKLRVFWSGLLHTGAKDTLEPRTPWS